MSLPAFQDSLRCDKIYSYNQIHDVMQVVRTNFRFAHSSNRKIRYFNVPMAFDIETSSFYRTTGYDSKGREIKEKAATMYVWQFGIYGLVIMGRTWEEFISMIQDLVTELNLNTSKRVIIYVHSLAFEFQFIRKLFTWENVFSISSRTPIYALTDTGVEFRCSYLLSGYSLAKLGDQLLTYQVHKMVGDLDYDLIRHSKTPLSDVEVGYCVNDVKVVMAYIAEKIETDGSIARIPLTKTGYVRLYCRNSCFYDPDVSRKKSIKRKRYKELINSMVLDPEEYQQLKRAFQGGFTHADPFYSGKVVYDVTSFDFTSSYPAVMISEKFPMSSAERVTIESVEDLEKNLKLYCCIFDVQIEGLESILWFENYISESRCTSVINGVISNGRIVSAERITTTITEQDYLIIKKFYRWKKIRIANFKRYKKDYLPTDFVKAILKLYQDKTTLKGVEGKELEYLQSKEMLNSCYGMSVTDIVRDPVIYTDHWLDKSETDPVDVTAEIEKYNKSQGRFLFYPWGVWVTAYARRNLFSGIIEFGEDYVYSDTDSIKVLNADKHMDYINNYNRLIKLQLDHAMEYHGIDLSETEPKTIEGISKPLGVWDFDGHYSKFKTLGAKRYLVEYSKDPRNKGSCGSISLTVSGLNKKRCVPWMLQAYGRDHIFDAFHSDFHVPEDFTGKLNHTYIDHETEGFVTDYMGNTAEYREKSAVHMCKSDYCMKLSREYSDYLLGLQDVDY